MKRIILLCTILVFPLLAMAQPTWDEQIIAINTDGPIIVHTADIDGDGDMDVVNSGWFDDKIVWHENLPNGWNSHTIDPEFPGNRTVSPVDIDLDGDMDVLSAAFSGDELAWYEQDGNNWTKHVISSAVDGPVGVEGVDLDQDGDIDVLCTAFNGDKIYWFENENLSFTEHEIGRNYNGANGIMSFDIDQDGDIDIATSSQEGNQISWWENDNFNWIEHDLSQNMASARCVAVGDMDGDGDPDIVGAAVIADEIAWWENRGGGEFAKHIVSCGFDGARYVKIIDVDNDGDNDLVATALWQDEVAWFENVGDDFTKHVVSSDLYLAKGVDAADLDDDGDIDIVGASYQADNIIVYTQDPDQNRDKVSIELTPHEYPITVQREEEFLLDLEINIDNFFIGYYGIWIEIMLPNGHIYGPTYYNDVWVIFSRTITSNNYSQYIPANAPYGEYQWMMSVGDSGEHAYQTASFRFTVEPSQSADEASVGETKPGDWTVTGLDIPEYEDEAAADFFAQPRETALGKAYPNPFNAQVVIPLSVANDSDVRLTVHNTLGQEVAVLQDGTLIGGTHEFSFQAQNLSTGLYFVQATVDGRPLAPQKLMLLW